MRDAEADIAEALSNDGWLTVLDGPLHGIRHRRGLPVIGYVKTHHPRMLAREHWVRVPELTAGERSGLFATKDALDDEGDNPPQSRSTTADTAFKDDLAPPCPPASRSPSPFQHRTAAPPLSPAGAPRGSPGVRLRPRSLLSGRRHVHPDIRATDVNTLVTGWLYLSSWLPAVFPALFPAGLPANGASDSEYMTAFPDHAINIDGYEFVAIRYARAPVVLAGGRGEREGGNERRLRHDAEPSTRSSPSRGRWTWFGWCCRSRSSSEGGAGVPEELRIPDQPVLHAEASRCRSSDWPKGTSTAQITMRSISSTVTVSAVRS